MPARRVLVVGGAGAFGSRLVERLLATTDYVVVIAGRDPERTTKAAEELSGLHPGFPVEPVVLDGQQVAGAELRALRLWAVIDAAGPYQNAEPHLARAAIEAGCHYLDLADARDFVGTIPALDPLARRAGVVVLTGASSTPALTHAVVDRLTRSWSRVDRVYAAIASGNRAPRGLAVIRAILSWVGRPVRVYTDGAWQVRAGWGMPERRQIPGLGRRWVSLAETPDLDLMVQRYRPVRSALFKAGLELPLLHLGLYALSYLSRPRFMPPLTWMAVPLQRAARWFENRGSDRGGMVVEVIGFEAAGRRVRSTWTLVAEAGVGPTIPTLPAVAALKVIATGKLLPRADVAAGRIPLEAIEAEFAKLPIRTETVTVVPEPQFRSAIGPRFDRLPTPVRLFHSPASFHAYSGRADVEGASNRFAAFVAARFELPHPGRDVSVRVEVEDIAESGTEREVWRRDFAGRSFVSCLVARKGSGTIEETLGPVTVRLRLEPSPEGLGMTVEGWRLGVVPMPRFLRPTCDARESVDEAGRFRFDVSLHLPLRLGRLVRYAGWLLPETRMT